MALKRQSDWKRTLRDTTSTSMHGALDFRLGNFWDDRRQRVVHACFSRIDAESPQCYSRERKMGAGSDWLINDFEIKNEKVNLLKSIMNNSN